MIMPRGSDQLLLPVNPLFIAMTLIIAVALEMVPFGRNAGAPDLVALVLAFWNVHQPLRIGVGVGFVLGLVMDVQQGAVLGQHALAYTLLSYFAITIHRRLLWFTPGAQALHVLPLFAATHLTSLLLRMAAGADLPGWSMLLAPVFESLLWAPVSWLLLVPQRRAPDPDKNRPL